MGNRIDLKWKKKKKDGAKVTGVSGILHLQLTCVEVWYLQWEIVSNTIVEKKKKLHSFFELIQNLPEWGNNSQK